MNYWPWKPTKHLKFVLGDNGCKLVLQQRWRQFASKSYGTKTYNYEWRNVPVKGSSHEHN